jgi:hypothetical protein
VPFYKPLALSGPLIFGVFQNKRPSQTRGVTGVFYKKLSSLLTKNNIKKKVSEKVVMIIM